MTAELDARRADALYRIAQLQLGHLERLAEHVERIAAQPAAGGSRVYVLSREDRRPSTANDLGGKGVGAAARRVEEIRNWRAWAKGHARAAPFEGRVILVAQHLRLTAGAIPDVGAPFHAVKGMIDGLVDAGVLAGDAPKHAAALVFTEPLICGLDGVRLWVRSVSPAELAGATHDPLTGILPAIVDTITREKL